MENTQSSGAAGLTPEEVQVLQARLQALRTRLLGREKSERAVGRDAEPLPAEPMDAAEQTRTQEDAFLANDRDLSLRGEIEHALNKIAAGTYGLSELSGEPIGFRRLLAIPWARTTIDEEESGEDNLP
jgi:DnaK suppressor protein